MILYFMITFAFQIGKGFAIMVALFSFRVGNFRFDLENNSSCPLTIQKETHNSKKPIIMQEYFHFFDISEGNKHL